MEQENFYVNITPEEAGEIVARKVLGSFSGEVLDKYVRRVGDKQVVMMLFEKHYMRSSNRATLTFLADNLDGRTKVHLSAGGGGEGLFFRFDWGAGSSFANLGRDALKDYICNY